jgi:hypothetical protein
MGGSSIQEEEMTWQPIETAPKNETPILSFGHWAGEIAGRDKEPGVYIVAWHGGRTDYPGFDWDVQATDAYAAWVKPTHWMPLPEPPK